VHCHPAATMPRAVAATVSGPTGPDRTVVLTSTIVGGELSLAPGVALAQKMGEGEPGAITAVFFGDGAACEGIFHEALNLAATWELPVLFLCENNLYAMGTALARHQAQTDLALRAAAYGMVSWAVDGMDVDAVAAAARRAVGLVRSGAGPCFLELRTYRFRAHSMYDADRYRDKAEIEAWKQRDPLPALASRLRAEDSLDDDTWDAMEAEVAREIDAAVDTAEAAPTEPVEDLTRFVRSEQVPP